MLPLTSNSSATLTPCCSRWKSRIFRGAAPSRTSKSRCVRSSTNRPLRSRTTAATRTRSTPALNVATGGCWGSAARGESSPSAVTIQMSRARNIGNPPAFGFQPPPQLVAAVERAMRDGHNGYGPSAGIPAARDAVAGEYTSRGFPVTADRVFITEGTSEAIDLALTALVDDQGEVLVPMPTYPLYTAVLAKLGARARLYRCDRSRQWAPDLDHLRSLITPATRALVVIDP